MVPRAGIEPAWCYHRGILNPLRLPVSPPGLIWRLRPESDRRTRLCRPLHDHSATQPYTHDALIKKKRPWFAVAVIWSGKRGSNSRPQPWQGCALPLSYSRVSTGCDSTGNCHPVNKKRVFLTIYKAITISLFQSIVAMQW